MSYNNTVQKHNLFQGEKNQHYSNIFTLTINPIHTFNSAKHTTILSLEMFQCVNRLKCCMVRYYRHMLNSHSHCVSNLHEKETHTALEQQKTHYMAKRKVIHFEDWMSLRFVAFWKDHCIVNLQSGLSTFHLADLWVLWGQCRWGKKALKGNATLTSYCIYILLRDLGDPTKVNDAVYYCISQE